MIQPRLINRSFAAVAAVTLAFAALTPARAWDHDNDGDDFTFDLVRSNGLANFPTVAPNAHGRVHIQSVGPVEIMDVTVWGLPPNTDFDF
ncbi:MAG: hypothetical protein JO069_02160, partial [Verrucomicrobia bacterium]|nr:hypothetical protein [Verrucomicrobiota bacterium]